MSGVTQILHAIGQGDRNASDELLAIVYDELHRIASRKLAGEAPGHTLQTTALVHEAYLRLLPQEEANPKCAANTETTQQSADNDTPKTETPSWVSRSHFFAAAAEAMRRILIDNARRKKRLKRGGDRGRVELGTFEPATPEADVDLLALDEALIRLESHDPEKANIVKLRYFAGLTLEDTASALNVSVPTVHRKWRYARAWLKREMGEE